jgi:hypothetical protein
MLPKHEFWANSFVAASGIELGVSPVALIFPQSGTPLAELAGTFSMADYASGTLTATLTISAEEIVTTGNCRFNLAWRDASTERVVPLSAAAYDTPQASDTISRGATPAVLQFPTIDFSSTEIDGVTTGEAQLLLSRDNSVGSNAGGIIYVHKLELSEA